MLMLVRPKIFILFVLSFFVQLHADEVIIHNKSDMEFKKIILIISPQQFSHHFGAFHVDNIGSLESRTIDLEKGIFEIPLTALSLDINIDETYFNVFVLAIENEESSPRKPIDSYRIVRLKKFYCDDVLQKLFLPTPMIIIDEQGQFLFKFNENG